MKNRKELAVFLGIVAGFICLLSFFVGLEVPAKSIWVAGVFFAIITVTIRQLLFSPRKPIK